MNARIAFGLVVALIAATTVAGKTVGVVRIDGPIGPATAGYISRGIQVAADRGDTALIITLDTPGGLLDSTQDIIQSFYASRIPVVVFVSPEGANAGSAGVFITLAADVAAMAPNTSIGAAHPVAIGGAAEGGQKVDETTRQKLENFAVSYIAAIAEKRGRNVEWARSAVKDSASITSSEALDKRVIDLIAPDLPSLLASIDGRDFRGMPIRTKDASVEDIPMVLRERVFQTIWHPEVMFVLMLLAVYGLIGELSNPGAILPGVVGAIALVLALYMGAVLPVSATGIALILLALGLFIADAMAPTHGILTAGGIISFFLGAMMLFDSVEPAFRLSLTMIIPATLITAAFFSFIVGAGIRAQFLPARTGMESLRGASAVAMSAIDRSGGRVLLDGEDWRAESETPISKGESVEVVSAQGLSLSVKPKSPGGAP